MTEDDLVRFYRMQCLSDNRVRQAICFGAGRALDPRRLLARKVERQVRALIAECGIVVTGTRHKEKFDLLAQGVRIEVKASRWDGIRYSCNLHGNSADVLVWACIDGDVHYFVIPFSEVRGLTVLKITAHDPRDYCGKWLRWYAAWDVLDEMIAAGRNAWQPALMELV